MYQRFFGLRELPFELTPNPAYLFLPQQHRDALSTVQYGLLSAKAITVLIGEAGTGKTTLLRAALESQRCRDVRPVCISNPRLTRAEFLHLLAGEFELGHEALASKGVLLGKLEPVLQKRRERGEITALVVDEAQTLSIELLEEIRLLANIETTTEKLLPVLLAGQPEFATRLEQPALRQLKQRVALRAELTPFELRDTAAYIGSRIAAAGGQARRMFTREAIIRIHEYSGGIPRTISVICDNALTSGMALGRQPVDQTIVQEVCVDLRLRRRGDSTAFPAIAPAAATQKATEDLEDDAAAEGGEDVAEERAEVPRWTRRRFVFGRQQR